MKANPETSVKEPKRMSFRAVHNVVIEGETFVPGSIVELTRKEYDFLKEHGSIEDIEIEERQAKATRHPFDPV